MQYIHIFMKYLEISPLFSWAILANSKSRKFALMKIIQDFDSRFNFLDISNFFPVKF